MSGRGNKKLSRKNDENRRWHIGVYGRRSFDDGENSESYTIKNQKALIESFLENRLTLRLKITILMMAIPVLILKDRILKECCKMWLMEK